MIDNNGFNGLFTYISYIFFTVFIGLTLVLGSWWWSTV